MTDPLTPAGPCQPWITDSELALYRPGATDMDPAIMTVAIGAATDLLYSLSGRKYVGQCTAVVRPTAKPLNWSLARWQAFYNQLTGKNWTGNWGSCNGADEHGLCVTPPQLDLGVFPLQSIEQVLIDGVLIPSDEYQIYNERWLVRTLPSRTATATERYGWPTCQDLRLPSTEIGTFEVTATFGMAPPLMGKIGCAALAVEMAKLIRPKDGSRADLPSRVTSISRQGVTTSFLSLVDITKSGLTGIYETDMFIRAVNPQKQFRPPLVYSPDLGTVRRPS